MFKRIKDFILGHLVKSETDEVQTNFAAAKLYRYFLTTLLPTLLEAHRDFAERKLPSDFRKQCTAIISVCQSLLIQIPSTDEKLQNMCSKLVANVLQRSEVCKFTDFSL